MYTDINFKTKKALKEAVARGNRVTYHQPGGIFLAIDDGLITLEGHTIQHHTHGMLRL